MNHIPDWLNKDKVSITLDARPMLEAGLHPMNEVFEGLGKLGSGEILALITGFLPVPLIDKAKEKYYQVYTDRKSKDEFLTYFYKSP